MTTQFIAEKIKLKIIPLTLVVGGLALAGTSAFLFLTPTTQIFSKKQTVIPGPTAESLTTSLKQKTQLLTGDLSSTPPKTLDEVRALAAQRKPLMATLLTSNPSKFAQLALTNEEFEVLPPNVQTLVEQRIVMTGLLNIRHEDFFDVQGSSNTLFLEVNAMSHPLYLSAALPENTPSGSTVEISGWQLDDALLASSPTGQARNNESGITVLDTPAITAVTGDQKTLVVLVHPTSLAPGSLTNSDVNQAIFSATDSTNQFFQKNSYGYVSLSGSVRGWYGLNVPSNTCGFGYAQPTLTAADVYDPALALNTYDHLVILYPNYCAPAGGFAQLMLTSSDGTRTYNVMTVSIWGSFANDMKKNVAHEFGHAFGNGHANYHNCQGVTDIGGASVSIDSRCANEEYNDPFDTMGNISYAHFNTYHKIASGWLASENLRTIIPTDMGPEGYTDFQLEPIATDSSPGIPGTTGLKAIRIQRGASDYLYVEYRQPLDFDAALPVVNPNNVYDGALLHFGNTLLIDATPDATANNGNRTPTLSLTSPCTANPTQAFTDPVTQAKIKVCAKTASLLTVRVWLTPDTVLPTVNITYPQNNDYFNQTLSVTGQATDNTYVSRVDFYLDNSQTPVTTTTNPNLFPNIPISSLSDGQHTVTVKAVDGSGNVGTSTPISFRVDNTSPSVTVINPQPNVTISGVYQIQVNAQDSQGLKKVEVQLDFNQFQPLFVDTTSCLSLQPCPPYLFEWNTFATANGNHTLRVRAENMAGVNTYTLSIPITVSNIENGGGGLKCGSDQELPPCPQETQ